jgi:hypothetical protein
MAVLTLTNPFEVYRSYSTCQTDYKVNMLSQPQVALREYKTGTVRMLPPPPIKPNAVPISMDAK